MISVRTFVAAASIVLLSGAAPPPPRSLIDCRGEPNDNAQADCITRFIGAEPVALFAERKEQFIRLIEWDAWMRPQTFVDIERTDYGQVWMTVRDSGGAGRGVVMPLSEPQWLRIVQAWPSVRDAKPHEDVVNMDPAKGPKIVSVCVDGNTVAVDSVLVGKVDRHTDYCNETYFVFRRMIEALVVETAPYCKPVVDRVHRIHPCLILDGDKYAAADAFVRQVDFTVSQCKDIDDTKITGMVADDALLRRAGAPEERGPAAMVAMWRSLLCSGQDDVEVQPVAVFGAPGQVTLTGRLFMERYHPKEVSFTLPLTQIWRLGADGVYRLALWEVGPAFKQERSVP